MSTVRPQSIWWTLPFSSLSLLLSLTASLITLILIARGYFRSSVDFHCFLASSYRYQISDPFTSTIILLESFELFVQSSTVVEAHSSLTFPPSSSFSPNGFVRPHNRWFRRPRCNHCRLGANNHSRDKKEEETRDCHPGWRGQTEMEKNLWFIIRKLLDKKKIRRLMEKYFRVLSESRPLPTLRHHFTRLPLESELNLEMIIDRLITSLHQIRSIFLSLICTDRQTLSSLVSKKSCAHGTNSSQILRKWCYFQSGSLRSG